MVKGVQAWLVNLFQALPKPFQSKYMLCFCIFFVWMVFFDRNRLITQYQLERIMDKLEADKKFYLENLQETISARKSLDQNKEIYIIED